MRDGPVLPKGASVWTQIGLAADWLSEPLREREATTPSSRRASRPAGATDRTRLAAQHTSHADYELEPRLQHGKGGIAFVGGLADEQGSKAVYNTYKAHVAKGFPAAYFSESQGDALGRWLDDNAGNVTAVWAHSYGVPAAAEQFSRGHGKGVPFYSVDGVGRLPVDLEAVRRTSGYWVNFTSTSNATRNDAIAKVGRRWADDPAGYATRHHALPHDHVDIWYEVAPQVTSHPRNPPTLWPQP